MEAPTTIYYLRKEPMLVKQLIRETLELQSFCIESVKMDSFKRMDLKIASVIRTFASQEMLS